MIAENPMLLMRAGCVAPMNGPLIRDGAIVFEDERIVAVGAAEALAAEYPAARIIDRRDCTVFPGLVNAHTHLELSEAVRGPESVEFADWLLRLAPTGPTSLTEMRAAAARAIPIGVSQCLKFGVTSVGDISRHCTVTRPLLRDGPLRVVSYGEVQAMATRRDLLEERIATAVDTAFESNWLRVALSPHAPYSVEIGGYARCAAVAESRGLPLATHLAEAKQEAEFLANQTGPFRELWDRLGAWDDRVPRFVGGPIRMAESVGLLNQPSLLAHVNWCDDEEMNLLTASQVSVVYCPRTHAYFRHPPHRWREMMQRGIHVAVGTDSCASSPDLNLVDELRVLRRLAPDLPALDLWRMATVQAAKAIQMDRDAGTLEPGKFADMTLFRVTGDHPPGRILDSAELPVETWIGGRLRSA